MSLEDNECQKFMQFITMKANGTQYLLFFATEYGNSHTRNPVMHLAENSDNYPPVQWIHPRDDAPRSIALNINDHEAT